MPGSCAVRFFQAASDFTSRSRTVWLAIDHLPALSGAYHDGPPRQTLTPPEQGGVLGLEVTK
jgi:hypothetical protein